MQSIGKRASGALWILAGASCFSAMNSTAKFIPVVDGPQIHALQIAFARYLAAALVILPIVVASRKRPQLSSPFRFAIRTIAGFGGIAFMFIAVQQIPLASATAIGFTSPIFAMVFAALFLKEQLRRIWWAAAAMGLSGALLIASPGHTTLEIGAITALVAAAFMGAEIVAIKWLSETRNSDVAILLYSNLFGVVLAGIFCASTFVWPNQFQLALLAAVGAFAILGQVCVIKAARLVEASFLAPFFYSSLIYAGIFGYVVFDEVMEIQTAIGCMMILTIPVLMIWKRS